MSIHAVIQEWSDKPFTWGCDCCQFAAAVVEDLTGHNPMRELRYSTESEAREIIDRHGGLAHAMQAVLGDSIAVENASDGAVLLINLQDNAPHLARTAGPAMAGVLWKGQAIVRTAKTVMAWPLAWADRAWQV